MLNPFQRKFPGNTTKSGTKRHLVGSKIWRVSACTNLYDHTEHTFQLVLLLRPNYYIRRSITRTEVVNELHMSKILQQKGVKGSHVQTIHIMNNPFVYEFSVNRRIVTQYKCMVLVYCTTLCRNSRSVISVGEGTKTIKYTDITLQTYTDRWVLVRSFVNNLFTQYKSKEQQMVGSTNSKLNPCVKKEKSFYSLVGLIKFLKTVGSLRY